MSSRSGATWAANLRWISESISASGIYGVDVNETAIRQLRSQQTGLNLLVATAQDLPFRDGWFDLVFTMGVLIHVPPESLATVAGEIVRCSSRFVLCGEYYSEVPMVLPYRGETRALFKRDFGAFYREHFPELVQIDTGFLPSDEGWDDITWWLFERG